MYLNTHSYYSYKYGCMSVEDVISTSLNNGIQQIALTEINNTSSALDFIRLSKLHNFKAITGIDFRNNNQQLYVCLAINNDGYYELNKYLSKHLHNNLDFFPQAPSFYSAYTIYPFTNQPYKKLRENEFIGVKPADLSRFRFSSWHNHHEKVVILQTSTFRNKKDFNAHRLLRAIDNNTLLSKLDKNQEGKETDLFMSRNDLINTFKEYPKIINNTEKILDSCNVDFEYGGKQLNNLKSYTGNKKNDIALLKQKCIDGIPYRYKNPGKNIYDRIEKEIEIITQKEFVSYFLINWDIIQYAQIKGYFYVGRGSGANSILAYLLRITDVDPIELDLYFERFINLYRTNPPDFDIDFSWTDRDDITKYIFNRFENTALLGTYNTFQEKGVIRELGKVFGIPKHEIDLLSKERRAPKDLDQFSKLVLQYSSYIHGFPSHLSVHSSGIIITDKPIEHFCGSFMPPKGFPTAQIDMVIAEDTGIYKFDILSQRGLGKIKDAIEITQKNNPDIEKIDIHNIQKFKKDQAIKALLREGQAMGCFYVESPAMRMLMKKLQVDTYLGLVAASSIIRPGVARSGMMREYILRYRYQERRDQAHPVMKDIMPETFGVMVYQEDVIKVAHYFAGLSLSEADVLRRAMSGKYRSRDEFQLVREKFFYNCFSKGYDEKIVNEVWNQIESFAGYAFSKGHSASYAVESFQSLYLKAYFPLEFMVAVINNGGGFYRTEFYLHEARMQGASIEAPCINNSSYLTTITGKIIYLGFHLINEIETNTVKAILSERNKKGEFKSFNDFLDRLNLPHEQLSILIRIEAFRFTNTKKRELLWHSHLQKKPKEATTQQLDIFKVESKSYILPTLEHSKIEDAYDQIEILGFPLCSPFLLLSQKQDDGEIRASDFQRYLNKTATISGNLVTIKYTRTSNKKIMHFGTLIDAEGTFFDITNFPPVVEKFPFRGGGIYKITGRVVEEFGFYSIETKTMYKSPYLEDPRYSESKTAFKKKNNKTEH